MANKPLIKTRSNGDQNPNKTDPSEIRDQRSETEGGLFHSPNPSVVSSVSSVVREVWHHLEAGLAWLDDNDHGRPWPPPRRSAVVSLCSRYPEDLCLKAAREAREIVIAQDRAPNITGLFEKKLRDLAGVREEARDSLEGT